MRLDAASLEGLDGCTQLNSLSCKVLVVDGLEFPRRVELAGEQIQGIVFPSKVNPGCKQFKLYILKL